MQGVDIICASICAICGLVVSGRQSWSMGGLQLAVYYEPGDAGVALPRFIVTQAAPEPLPSIHRRQPGLVGRQGVIVIICANLRHLRFGGRGRQSWSTVVHLAVFTNRATQASPLHRFIEPTATWTLPLVPVSFVCRASS